MKRLVQYALNDGSNVLVEADITEKPGDLVKVASTTQSVEVLMIKDKTFEDALDKIEPAADVLLEKFRSLNIQPEEIKVAFGIAADIKAGWFITTGAKTNFDVTLTWKKESNEVKK